jgi:hypothetical protein
MLFLAMGNEYEKSSVIAARMGANPVTVAEKMEDMAKCRLLFRFRTMPFILGIYEYQVDQLHLPLQKAFRNISQLLWLRRFMAGTFPVFGRYPFMPRL